MAPESKHLCRTGFSREWPNLVRGYSRSYSRSYSRDSFYSSMTRAFFGCTGRLVSAPMAS